MHNTGNPLGSKDILDLYDNSEVVDNFVNSQQDEVPDRFGAKRLTLAGLIKRSMALRNEINDFSGALTFKPEWSDVPMNVSEGVGGEGGALNLQAEALGNRSEINKITSRETLRRTYQEVGLNLVDGSFEQGAVITSTTDVVLHEKTGKCYSGPIGNVPKGTDPLSEEFVDKSNEHNTTFNTIAEMLVYGNFTVGQVVRWLGYHTRSDGGSNWGIVKSGSHVHDGGHIFSISSSIYIEANLRGNKISIMKFGANPDSTLDEFVTNNAPRIQALVNYLANRGGGHIYTPSPQVAGKMYGIGQSSPNVACVTVTSDKFTFSGDGPSSIWKTYTDSDVPLHFSSDSNLSNPSPTGDTVADFEVYGMHIKGTGVYQNLSLARGRGILFRNAKNVSVHDNTITSMTMIGICSEGGDGYFRVQNNQIHSCRYTGINYNGRCYQSIISGNIISKCNANSNSVAIQSVGHCIITNNTVYGEVANASNCGGIMWGEGNYDGIGIISNNLIKHTSYGILAIYHGSCLISDNVIINALVRGGIVASNGKTAGFTVENSNNSISGNKLINCGPQAITCSAQDTLIVGNKIRGITPITNPSASTEPDYIVGVTTQQGIRVRARGCSIRNNQISDCVHGLTTTIEQINAAIGGNSYKNNTQDLSLESANSGMFAAVNIAKTERIQVQGDVYMEQIYHASRPVHGYFERGSTWMSPTPAVGSPIGAMVLYTSRAVATADTVAGGTNITLSTVGPILLLGNDSVVGIMLDNGAWHWTTILSVTSLTITIATPIPVGRLVKNGASVLYNGWKNLAVI